MNLALEIVIIGMEEAVVGVTAAVAKEAGIDTRRRHQRCCHRAQRRRRDSVRVNEVLRYENKSEEREKEFVIEDKILIQESMNLYKVNYILDYTMVNKTK